MDQVDNDNDKEYNNEYDDDEYDDEEYDDDEYDDEEYNEEFEVDHGDPEDVANDELNKRIQDYEEQADMAALNDIVIDGENCNTHVQKTKSKVATTLVERKGRGPTKGLKKTSGDMHITFDSLNRPRGTYRHQYGQNIGFCMRKLNINWEWKTVSVGMKNAFWQDTMSLFNISDDPVLRKTFLATVGKRFLDFKAKLVSGWITMTRKRTKKEDKRQPYEVYKHIKIEDWELFKKTKTSEEAKKARERASRCAKMNIHNHHMGQRTYDESRNKWIKDGFYPTCKLGALEQSSNTKIEVNRGDDWYCAMHKLDKKTGQREIPNPETKEAANKYLEYREKQKKGDFAPSKSKDALHMALGEKPEHRGRVRGVGGVNVGMKMVFEEEERKARKRASSSVDRESLKNELRLELRAEFKANLKADLPSLLEEIGVNVSTQNSNFVADHDNQSIQAPDASTPTSEPKIHPVVQIEHDNNPQPVVLEDKTRCHLLIQDPDSTNLFDVATGFACGSKEGNTVHGKGIKPGHISVNVETVFEEFQTAPLPVPIPEYDILLLDDAVGTFVQWPSKFVKFSSNKESLIKKRKSLKVGEGKSIQTKESTPQKRTKKSMPHNLTKECLWLHTKISPLQENRPIEIFLDGTKFYFKSEVASTWVSKIDIEEFLSGAKLNISIIQVFMKLLQEEKFEGEVGWLCPESTSIAKINSNVEEVKTYIFNAISASVQSGHKYILAPIFQDDHWVLLVICVSVATIYLFDSINKPTDSLRVRQLVNFAFHRYKRCGGKINRQKPLWKFVKCAQQVGGLECGFYIMRYMLEVLKSCSSEKDLEQIYSSRREEPFTDQEINEIRDKWAIYFTNNFLVE